MGKVMSAVPLLRVEELAIGHGTQALITDLAFELRSGTLTALIGANGIGKSTLLRTLAGLHPPLGGSVRFGERSVATMSATERARSVSMVLTGRPPTGQLDVETVVSLGRQPWTGRWGTLNATDREQVDVALRSVGADHLRHKLLRTCSDGECQKVLIARALAQATPLILLDEPTAYLDLPNRAAVVRMLRRIAVDQGKAVLFSTHDLQLAMDLCDRILLLRREGLWLGTPADAITSGELEKAFAGDGIRFDTVSGSHHFDR